MLLDVEKRMRLNPAFDSVEVLRLTEEEGKGARYRIRVKHGERIIEYVTMWLEVEKDKWISYKSIAGPKFSVIQSLTETAGSTRMMQVEDLQEAQEYGELEKKLAGQLLKEWLLSIKSYLELDRNPATRLWKRFYDRFLLRARPQERRIAQLILMMEGGLLLAGLLTLLVFKLASLFT